MNTLIFASTDVIYKQVLKDIKVLDYSYPITNTILKEFDKRFKEHIETIYENSPKFFKDTFLTDRDSFKLYQKYYLLLYLINKCVTMENVPSAYKSWAQQHNYDSIAYFLKDPYPNENFKPNFKALYNEIISCSGKFSFVLSVMKEIRDKMQTESSATNQRPYPSDMYVELTSKYLHKVENKHLTFDYTDMTTKFRNMNNAITIRMTDDTRIDVKEESLQTMINKYNKIRIQSFMLSPYIYKDLEKYNLVYVVFPSLTCNMISVSGAPSSFGTVAFSGKFVKENNYLRFIPLLNTVSYVVDSCSTKRIQFYITTSTDEVIPYNKDAISVNRKDVYNMMFQNNPNGTLCEINSKDESWLYSITDRVIKMKSNASAGNYCGTVLLYSHNYTMCGRTDDTIYQVISATDIDLSGNYTLSSIMSKIGSVNFISKFKDIYTKDVVKITPTYILYENVLNECSDVFNTYYCESDIIKTPLNQELYCKAIYLMCGDAVEENVNVQYFYYLLNSCDSCDQYVFYQVKDNCYEVVAVNSIPEELVDVYVKIIRNYEVLDNRFKNENSENGYHEIRIMPNGELIYLKIGQYFSLIEGGEIYVLKEDGNVYCISSSIEETFYVRNPLEIDRMDSKTYSNIGKKPRFKVGERILKLKQVMNYSTVGNVKCSINKSDSVNVQFNVKTSCSEGDHLICNVDDKDYNCVKIGDGMLESDTRLEQSFDNGNDKMNLSMNKEDDIKMVLNFDR